MKLTETKKNKIKEFISKKHDMKEGVVDYIFGKKLVSTLEKDDNFLKLARSLDNDMDALRKKVEKMQKNGERIPYTYKAILNIK
jgi:hypothetical protein